MTRSSPLPAAEHARSSARIAQPRDHEPAQRAGTAGDQDLFVHAAFLSRCHTGAVSPVWIQSGELRVVYRFATGAGRITAIDLIADPDTIEGLDLIVAP